VCREEKKLQHLGQVGSEDVVDWVDNMNIMTKSEKQNGPWNTAASELSQETKDFLPSRPFKESTFLNWR